MDSLLSRFRLIHSTRYFTMLWTVPEAVAGNG
jgi:hypothetical protein